MTGWGGRRPGSGRKPKGPKAGVPHTARPALRGRGPVLVSLTLRDEARLRGARVLAAVREAAAGATIGGFRVARVAIALRRIDLVVEVKSRTVLVRGLQGLAVRLARRVNRLLGRTGRLFADRYALTLPEVSRPRARAAPASRSARPAGARRAHRR